MKELLHASPFSRGVLHLTADAGVFGEIGGDSNATFNSCCLQEETEEKVF